MNICIPMAGLGSRFKFTHKEPKPLIDVKGKPMFEAVVDTLRSKVFLQRFIFMVNKEMSEKFGIKEKIKAYMPEAEVISIKNQTEGALCTMLTASKYINTDESLVISNCDQIVEFDIDEFYEKAQESDGCIMTFDSDDPCHSYAKVENGFVTEVAEKIVISNHATVGIYYFKHGRDFVEAAAEKVGRNNREPNGEFYNCPVYNQLIKNGLKVTTFDSNKVFTIGTPDELRRYLSV